MNLDVSDWIVRGDGVFHWDRMGLYVRKRVGLVLGVRVNGVVVVVVAGCLGIRVLHLRQLCRLEVVGVWLDVLLLGERVLCVLLLLLLLE